MSKDLDKSGVDAAMNTPAGKMIPRSALETIIRAYLRVSMGWGEKA